MRFLNPWVLWGLPVVLLPVVIHLLNRLRYRTVRWAAVLFLISATRSSIRRARLRHYLVLCFRCLAILMLALMLARPLVGGWLGMAASGAPDTILVLMDRSASMEATDPRTQQSKRAHAIELLSAAGSSLHGSTRFVLIDSALRAPQEVASLSALGSMSVTAPTDTAADLPAMLRAAAEYLVRTRPGKAEIWITSDLQKASWRPESTEWQSLSAQISALPQAVRVRVLALCDPYGHNVSVSLREVKRLTVAEKPQLALSLNLLRVSGRQDTFPLIVTLDGSRLSSDISMPSSEWRFSRRLDLQGDRKGGGWGKAELPADDNPRDNVCYFSYGDAARLLSVLVAENAAAARPLRLAAAPVRGRLNQFCEPVEPGKLAGVNWREQALLVWQDAIPEARTMETIRAFVEGGGVAVFFPPGKADVPGPFDMTWGRIDSANAKVPFTVAAWDEKDGPLCNTDDGRNLPLGRLSVLRRQELAARETEPGAPAAVGVPLNWHVYAAYADGKPFLQGAVLGAGTAYVCSTLPVDEWSDLGGGRVLVPMIQRLLLAGGERLGGTGNGDCGEWKPAGEQEGWVSVDGSEPKDPRWQAGVYQCGAQRVALNIPPAEFDGEFLDKSDVERLMGDVPVQVLEQFAGRKKEVTQSEIWWVFLCLALGCLVVESALVMSDRLVVASPDGGPNP